MRFSKRYALMLGLTFLASLMQAAPKGFGSWQRLEMDDFSILSDASTKDIETFATTYAAFRHVMREQVVGPTVKLPRSVLVLFRRDQTFREHVPASKDDKFVLTNFTTEVDGTALTALSVSGDQSAAAGALFEFETIWMLRRAGVWVPLWMSQGTGQVLSTLRLRKGRCLFGESDLRFTEALNRSSYLPWPRFFGISNDSPEYLGNREPGLYHGQAWALMNWVLLSKPGGQQRFMKLVEELKPSLPGKAIADVMGISEQKFGQLSYGAMKTSAVWVPFDEKAVRVAWRVVPAGEAEVRAQLTDLLAAAGKADAAAGELAQAQLLAPEAPFVLEARARAALRKPDREEAASLYQRAIAAGSKNPQAYLVSANVRLDGSSVGGGTDYPGGGGNNAQLALGEIRQALALVPGSLEAYEAMGRAFFIAPKITVDDIEELSRGIGPGRTRVRHYRALLYERLDKRAESIADLQAVIADPDCPSSLRRSSQQRLAEVMFTAHRIETEALVKARKFTEARAVIAAAKQDNSVAAGNYDRLEAWLVGQERAQIFTAVRVQVEGLVDAKEFPAALAVADEAIAAAKDESSRKGIGQLRAWAVENGDLHRIQQLYESRQWAEFRSQAEEFLRQHPKHAQASMLRRASERAAKLQAGASAVAAPPSAEK